ncbi:MAG: TVP38/TMEM64 family protein [Ktedonobacteraceae bacterium]|nr:TVP38/TMEM64 family protein [Ktedonobacteraceae bacterium]
MQWNSSTTKKIGVGVILLALLAGGGALLLIHPDLSALWRTFSSMEEFRKFVQGAGIWAPLLFFLLQTLQIIVSPIPGNVTTLAGGAMFGFVPGFLLSGSSMLLGSLIAFFLGRIFGQKLVIKLIGAATFEKYSRFVSGKYSLSLLVFFLVPFFPDDALCLLAGISSLPTPVFFLFLIIGRLPSVVLTTLIGAGLLEFSLGEWILFGLLSLLVIFFFLKYGDVFENWLLQKMPQKQAGSREKVAGGVQNRHQQ